MSATKGATARREPASGRPEAARVSPFALFCAYHLGLTDDDRYEFQNVHQVAKRFGTSAGALKQLLQDYAMDADALVHSSFDLASAQVDVMTVPEGVSRTALARTHYEAFLAAPRRDRDWARELADDARANEALFGAPRGRAAR